MFRRSGNRRRRVVVAHGANESSTAVLVRSGSRLRLLSCLALGGLAVGVTIALLLNNGDTISVGLVLFEIQTKAEKQEANEATTNTPTQTPAAVPHDDKDCPFRNSPIYRKVFVYPNHGDVKNGWSGDILSPAGRNLSSLARWPWLDMEESSRRNATGHYNIKGQNVQYSTELLVREIMINPKSCLRTSNPEEATLFYVPYLPSVEHHKGSDNHWDYNTSPYGKAILDILDSTNYTDWENYYGLTSKYWKRRKGADHILVFSEPMHGLYHPRSRRGNYHFVHSQKQLHPPIVISVELSTTFMNMYPKCSAKNILMPYPNTDGSWFNGAYKREAREVSLAANLTVLNSTVAVPAEREIASALDSAVSSLARPVAQYYSAGMHGTCTKLRKSMQQDYRKCAPSFATLENELHAKFYGLGMRLSTFCPCPGGDSPSAKRHFDAILAECIPIILSSDFVWPFTKEFDPAIEWDPNDFSIRLPADEYTEPLLDPTTCQPLNASRPGLQLYLDSIAAAEIQRLRMGMQKAKYMYSWYREDESLAENPLRDGVLPDGGAAHTLVQMLADRASGARWPACEAELKLPRGAEVWKFKC
jgi:hypothetical protein